MDMETKNSYFLNIFHSIAQAEFNNLTMITDYWRIFTQTDRIFSLLQTIADPFAVTWNSDNDLFNGQRAYSLIVITMILIN